jgi:hypothetical protein
MFDALMWLVLAIVFVALPISIILLIIRAIKKKPIKKNLKLIGALVLAALVVFVVAMFAPDDTPTEESQSTTQEAVISTTAEATTEEITTTEPTTAKPQCAHDFVEIEYKPDLSTGYASIKSECSLCGEFDFDTEKLSDERMAKYLEEDCTTYTYDEIARNPDKHKNEIIALTGEVIQVQELLGTTTLLVNVTNEGNEYYSYYTDTVYVNYKYSDELKILNGDIITMCGKLQGEESYLSVLGQIITVPSIEVYYAVLNE